MKERVIFFGAVLAPLILTCVFAVRYYGGYLDTNVLGWVSGTTTIAFIFFFSLEVRGMHRNEILIALVVIILMIFATISGFQPYSSLLFLQKVILIIPILELLFYSWAIIIGVAALLWEGEMY